MNELKCCPVETGAAHRFDDIRDNDCPLDLSKFISIVKNANQMRERFTILDLAMMLGLFSMMWKIWLQTGSANNGRSLSDKFGKVPGDSAH